MKFIDLVGNQAFLGRAIQFNKGIETSEMNAEPGMRATLISAVVENKQDNVIEVVFDYTLFEQFNMPLEVPNYYDKQGMPTLTAREAGHYEQKESYYFDGNDEVEGYFSLLDKDRVERLQKAFAESGEKNYVEWLEKWVITAFDATGIH